MISIKRQKNMTLEEELARLVGAKYATGEQWKIAPEGMKMLRQSGCPTKFYKFLRREEN